MSRASIYLAGWLTTVVIAVVTIVAISGGAFGASDTPTSAPQQLGNVQGDLGPQPYWETDASAGLLDAKFGFGATDATLSSETSGTEQMIYVYPDGSAAPDPQTARTTAVGYYDDDDDHDDDDHDDDDHDDNDHDDDHDAD